MLGPSNHAFSSEFFMPHGHCYLWEPGLLWVQVTSNGLIGISYVAIASTLAVLGWRVRELAFKAMYLGFGAFIITGGLTHFLDIWVIWKPDYWPDAALRIVTAAASVGMALTLPPLVPKALALVRAAIAAHNRGIALETVVQDLGSLSEKTRQLILGPVARLRAYRELSDEHRQDLDLVYKNTQALLEHVDDLLDVARLEAGKLPA